MQLETNTWIYYTASPSPHWFMRKHVLYAWQRLILDTFAEEITL